MIELNQLISTLSRLGLNQYEAKAYISLLAIGSPTAGELAEDAKIPRSRVYDVLSSLEDKGFVVSRAGRPTKYKATDPSELVGVVKKHRQEDFEKSIGELDRLSSVIVSQFKEISSKDSHSTQASDMAWTIQGNANIYSKINALIQKADKYVDISTSAKGLEKKVSEIKDELKEAVGRGAQVKVITATDEKTENLASRIKEFADIKEDDSNIHKYMLFDDSDALVFLTDSEHSGDNLAMWINSPHFCRSYKSLFDKHFDSL